MAEESTILEEAGLDRIYEAASRIRDTFEPLEGKNPPDEEIAMAEYAVRGDMKTIYIALFAMASAELEIKSRSSSWFFLSTVSYEFDEIAHITAETPYSTRGEDNFLEITNLILRFFSTGERTGRRDLFFFLRGITEINLSRILKEISRTEKRLMHYVFTAVTRHVAAEPRYGRRAETVTDLEAARSKTGRRATADEITAGCAHMLRGNETPGRMVDTIFDWLREEGSFAPRLHVSTLRTAVFELVKTRFIRPASETAGSDPMQEYLQGEMLQLAREALDETAGSYNWRGDGSGRCRDAYIRAGWDMLEEIVVHGRKMPHHEALGRHIEGCDRKTYREKYMGSFQNFWKVLWGDFLKKIRADS